MVESTEGKGFIPMYLAQVEGNQVSHSLQPKSQTDRHTYNERLYHKLY